MSSTNKTPNYALPQFIPTDKPTWLGDVNAAMLAIDTAMADNHTIAEGANTTAAGAEAKVQSAVDTANEAKVDSAAALQTATSATGVAQNALTAATSATQTANAASTQAQQAAGTASQANAVAQAASNLANQTAAGLTEFEHKFNGVLRRIESPVGLSYPLILANPAVYNVQGYVNGVALKAGENELFKSEFGIFSAEAGSNYYLSSIQIIDSTGTIRNIQLSRYGAPDKSYSAIKGIVSENFTGGDTRISITFFGDSGKYNEIQNIPQSRSVSFDEVNPVLYSGCN